MGHDVTKQKTLLEGATIRDKQTELRLSETNDCNVRYQSNAHCGLGKERVITARVFSHIGLLSFLSCLLEPGPSGPREADFTTGIKHASPGGLKATKRPPLEHCAYALTCSLELYW